MKSLKLFIILGGFSLTISVRIIEFKNIDQEVPSNFSTAKLDNGASLHLPDHFILCSSHYQTNVHTKNTHTIYVIYQDGEFTLPWLNIGIWNEQRLWVNVGHNSWHILGVIDSEDLFKWMHICLEIDLVKGSISSSMNGKSFGVTKVSDLSPSPSFNIQLGIVHHSVSDIKRQFHGKVANIQLLLPNVKNVTVLSNNLCKKRPELNILSWSEMEWNMSGNNIQESNVSSSMVCPTTPYADLRVPFEWTKSRAKDMCFKIGNGQIASPGNDDSRENWKIYDDCEMFWTPYLYDEDSGSVEKEYSHDEKVRLNWLQGFPVNGTPGWQNVIFYPARKYFENAEDHKEICLVCNTSLKTIYTMRGNCKYSLLGEGSLGFTYN